MPATPETSAIFDRALAAFKSKLTPTQLQAFAGTTATSVEVVAKQIEIDHNASETAQNMNRIVPFMQALSGYSDVINVFVQTSDVMAFIWGPVCLLLKVAAKWHTALDKLLDALENIGDKLDIFDKYSDLFHGNTDPRLQDMLGRVYSDVLNILSLALRIFPRSILKQIGISIWPPFENRLNTILEKFDADRRLLESALTAENFKEARRIYKAVEARYEKEEKTRKALVLGTLRQSLRPVLSNQKVEDAREVVEKRKDTGKWLLDSVNDWLLGTGKARVVLLTGIPGAGKTVLSSILVDQLKKLQATFPDNQVYAVYLSYQQGRNHTCVEALSSLLYQAVGVQWELFDMLAESFPDLQELGTSKRQLQQAITKILAFGRTFISVDGLDEMPEKERKALLDVLKDILDSNPDIRLYLTSRSEVDIINFVVKSWPGVHQHLSVTPDLNFKDLRDFALEGENLDMLVRRHKYKDDEARTLLLAIAKKAEGMFLYTKLVLAELYEQTCPKEVQSAVNNLPKGLNEAYDRVFQRMNVESPRRKRIKRVLKLLLGARRPLRVAEISQAIMMDHSLCGSEYDPQNSLSMTIEELCGSLVEIKNDCVAFVHFSVQEYLLQHDQVFRFKEPRIHKTITIICLRYLCLDNTKRGMEDSEFEPRLRRGEYSLFGYTYANWLSHLKASMPKGTVRIESKPLELLKIFCSQHFPLTFEIDNSVTACRVQNCLLAAQDHCGRRSRNIDSDDPSDLTLFAQRINSRLRQAGDQTMDAGHSSLVYYYGNLFRCSDASCDYFTLGFDSRRELDDHELKHLRPFKCDIPWCPKFIIGFVTKTQLKDHMGTHETKVVDVASSTIIDSGDGSDRTSSVEELCLMLMDAIETEDFKTAHAFFDKIKSSAEPSELRKMFPWHLRYNWYHDFTCSSFLNTLDPTTALEAAAQCKESAILHRLLDELSIVGDVPEFTLWYKTTLSYILFFAVSRGTEVNAEIILKRLGTANICDLAASGVYYFKYDLSFYSSLLFAAVKRENDDMTGLLIRYGANPVKEASRLLSEAVLGCDIPAIQKSMKLIGLTDLTTKTLASKGLLTQDDRDVSKAIYKSLTYYRFSKNSENNRAAVVGFLQRNRFDKAVPYLDDDIGNIRFWVNQGALKVTAASKQSEVMRSLLPEDSKRAAEVALRLLKLGFDITSNTVVGNRYLKDYACAQKFLKYVGITWEQAIEDSKEARERVKRENPDKSAPIVFGGSENELEGPGDNHDFTEITDELHEEQPRATRPAVQINSGEQDHLYGHDNEAASIDIRCICGFKDVDSFTIQCDACDRWQHAVCFRLSEINVPGIWRCHVCYPERFDDTDIKRAREIQLKRRERKLQNQQRIEQWERNVKQIQGELHEQQPGAMQQSTQISNQQGPDGQSLRQGLNVDTIKLPTAVFDMFNKHALAHVLVPPTAATWGELKEWARAHAPELEVKMKQYQLQFMHIQELQKRLREQQRRRYEQEPLPPAHTAVEHA